ncbi:MAG: hypothetical protein ACI9JN_000170 [Bacteroidia bacterium]|jgi:hypothetical protein
MKKLNLIWIVVILFGCKEVPPFIDRSAPIVLASDTTYITTDIPQNIKKNVLIEDISGVRCNNCPKAAVIAHDIQERNDPGRIVVLTLHSNKNGGFTMPFENGESKDTFNTIEATEIISTLIGEPIGLPAGAIDRKLFEGETSKVNQKYATWESQVNLQLALEAKAKLELEVIKKSGRTVVANVKTTFAEADATPVYLSIFIVESKIKSKQKLPDNTYDKDFVHNAILRKGVTNYAGIELAQSVEIGRVFEKGFEFEIPEKYIMDNCTIVVLVNKNDPESTEIIQCIEMPI